MKCKQCGKEFKPFNSVQPVCSYICALKYNDKKQVDKRVKEMKKNVEKKSSYEEILQKQINTIVRLIDKDHPCISTGTPYGKYIVNAGHYSSVGSNSTLRYNLLNIYNQSKSDNFYKGGKGSNYSIRLKEVFGISVRDEIENLPAKYKTIRLTVNELIEATLIAKEIVSELKAVNRTFTTEERIVLRKEFNERIGIYK
jgi:hypothetical protein